MNDLLEEFTAETGMCYYSRLVDMIFAHLSDYKRTLVNIGNFYLIIIIGTFLAEVLLWTAIIFLAYAIGQLSKSNRVFLSGISFFVLAVAKVIASWEIIGRLKYKHTISWAGSVPVDKEFIPSMSSFIKEYYSLDLILVLVTTIIVISASLIMFEKK